MASKTFKIGECAKGGIISAEVKGDKIAIICKAYVSKKELERKEVSQTDSEAQWELKDTLNDWTSHYYAEQVMDWIKANSSIKTSFFR